MIRASNREPKERLATGDAHLGSHAEVFQEQTMLLRQSEAYLAEAQRLSHTGSWAFDLATCIYVYVSEECIRIFELDDRKDLRTREAVSRLIHPEDWDGVKADFERAVREKVDTTSEFRITVPSGTAGSTAKDVEKC